MSTTVESPYNHDDQEDIIPKAVITVAVIAGAFIIGLIVAKLVDMCYERASISDNASDISEYTKQLLKIQFTLAFRKKKDGKESPEDIARRMIKLWRIGVVKKKRMRKIEAKKKAEAEKEAKEAAKKGKGKASDKSKPKDPEKGAPKIVIGVKAASGSNEPAKVHQVNEKADAKKPPPKDNKDNKDNKDKKENKPEEPKPVGPLIVSSDPLARPDVDAETVKNGAKPSLTDKESKSNLHKDFVEFRADSDDLMIPVSTDEGPKPNIQVTSGRRNSGSSKSDYEFLRDPDLDSIATFDSGRRGLGLATKTPSSLSAVKLESKDKNKDTPRDTSRGTPTHTKPPAPASRPETSKSRAGPVSARPKSSAPTLTPTGRRPVSGKIVTPQGVKVVSRPKTPAGPKKF